MIRSVFDNQDELLKAVLQLIGGDRFHLDPCYSKGNFYKKLLKPIFRSDIVPQTSDTINADCRNLPLASKSISSIIFDPPFLATSGPSLKKEDENNVIAHRFSVFPNEKELHRFYYKSIKEFYRLLKEGGYLVFKCQDKVSSGKQYFSHVYIHNMAISLGFYPKDLLVYVKKNRISAAWQTANQKHARKFHSYFWIFQKRTPMVREETLWRVS